VKDDMKSWADHLVERFHSIKAYAQELNFSEPLQYSGRRESAE
jgi:hypothetical protein